MNKSCAVISIFISALILAGCQADHVLFVTDTGIGLNYDSKPPNLSIDYHRYEGYVAPAYDNGALPPVAARITSHIDIAHPEVHQVYSTGDTAVLLTKKETPADDPSPMPLTSNSKKLAYFVTDSTTGLKISFDSATPPVPTAINFGYQRKEYSWIPVTPSPVANGCPGDSQKQKDARITYFNAINNLPAKTNSESEIDCYGDTLASIDLSDNITDSSNSGINIDQFIATGSAARNLASTNGVIRKHFKDELLPGSGVQALLGVTSLAATATSVPVYIAQINVVPVKIVLKLTPRSKVSGSAAPAVSSATLNDKDTQVSNTNTEWSVVLHESDVPAGKPAVLVFSLKNIAEGTIVSVNWSDPDNGEHQIGSTILVGK